MKGATFVSGKSLAKAGMFKRSAPAFLVERSSESDSGSDQDFSVK